MEREGVGTARGTERQGVGAAREKEWGEEKGGAKAQVLGAAREKEAAERGGETAMARVKATAAQQPRWSLRGGCVWGGTGAEGQC